MENLHSEYRSTYRWHEYRGARAQASVPPSGAAAGPVNIITNGAEEPVVRRAPLPSQATANGPRAPSIEPAMPRRKKYPGLAYKTNEIFDGPAAGLPSGGREGSSTLDRARSMERTKFLANSRDRRSKSEGPRNAQANGPRNWTDTVEEKATSPSIERTSGGSEYRNQYAWPRAGDSSSAAGAGYVDGAPRKSASMGALKAAQQARRRPNEGICIGAPPEMEPLMNHTDDDDDRKKYIEDFLREGEAPPNRKTTFRSAIASIRRGVGGDPQAREPAKPSKGYNKSEYKKKFRPFSHYVYEASKGTFTKRRAAKGADQGAERGADEPDGALVAAGAATTRDRGDNALQAAGLQSLGMKNADSWYREVLDLRKRAGEYKYRGWGTELAPDHLTELYNKQMELWYQVSRRSSLSALSLASTNHRVIGGDDTDSKRTSPSKKLKSFKSAPYQSIHAKLQETKVTQETPAQRAQRRKLQGHSFDNTSVSEGARGASAEPAPLFRSPKRRPRSADPKPLSQPEERRRPSKPVGLALNTTIRYNPSADGATLPAPRKPNVPFSSPKRKANRAKVGITIEDDDAIPLRSGSAFRDHRGTLLDDSPVVKSPPEPTRVKSPEQMNMRSPDPVNWTVPLDTGKTFTVTQNVKSDDLIKRPGSDFRGGWGGDDTHSASFSAPLDTNTHNTDRANLGPVPPEVAPVHQSPKSGDGNSAKEATPLKSVEISQRPNVTNYKHAKTPTSPPSLTPIDEMKVLDVAKPIVNGGGSSSSDTHPSPVMEVRLSGPKIVLDEPSNDAVKGPFKPTEATQKSHGVNTAVVSPTNQASVAAEVLEKARTRFDNFWGKKEGGNDSV